ncbi:hypothetical protein LG634_31335 [Streptomyces bambusae]|uniref:hypothetical protein n=1 Tax=Streptomyces bambusae TaxID=1550616 RepID=UPI001CFF86B1|nr:hypothetical protein [Streptomyces bambusae]MCB5169291.1 hypothetical protein [Streptomyces bambusae]
MTMHTPGREPRTGTTGTGEGSAPRRPDARESTLPPTGPGVIVPRLAEALGTAPVAVERGDGWIRAVFALPWGGPVPLTLDVVADTARLPRSLVYVLPGGGLNFSAAYFTPAGHNLAHHLRGRGHLVIGVTPREDAAGPGEVTAGWGLAAHRRDLRRVVRTLDPVLRLPYQYLGHSAGAALALDTAAADDSPRLRRVTVLDTTGPYTGDLAARAAQTRDVFQAQLRQGVHATDPGLAPLVARAVADPDGTSPVPRPADPASRFTHAGLAHFALTRTALLPGPANWIYVRGHSAGEYAFGAVAAEDVFRLDRTPLPAWHAAVSALGSGLVPTALMRDLAAVWAGDEGTYRIAWERVRAQVVWVNTELGRGDQPRGAELIRAAGNPRVTFTVLPGLGHADPLWSPTAEDEVWPLLTP